MTSKEPGSGDLTAVRKKMLVIVPWVVATLLLPLVPSHAADNSAPFSRGKVCLTYQGAAMSGVNSQANYCYESPFGFEPAEYATQVVECPILPSQCAGAYEVGRPTNLIAESARNGFLAVGGKEAISIGNPGPAIPGYPDYLYLADVRTAASIVDLISPNVTTSVTVTAHVNEIKYAESPYYVGLALCIRLFDRGPVTGTKPGASFTPFAAKCVDPSKITGDLIALGTIKVSNGIARKLSLEVELDNLFNDGGGSAQVTNISYTFG
ncbi:MAG: hypothetical protein ABR507_01370 [Actinomycetota bacterium]|nr:hypothetical protein [Actinomycetota bacterium]